MNAAMLMAERGAVPESLRQIEESLGLATAVAMVQHFGGLRLFIPKKPKPGHILLERLGTEVATALCRTYGGETITVPRGRAATLAVRNANIAASYDAGMTVRELAMQHQLTERQIYTILGRTALGK